MSRLYVKQFVDRVKPCRVPSHVVVGMMLAMLYRCRSEQVSAAARSALAVFVWGTTSSMFDCPEQSHTSPTQTSLNVCLPLGALMLRV